MAYPEKGIARRQPSAWLKAQCRADGGGLLDPEAMDAQPATFTPDQQNNNKFNLSTEDGLAAAKQKLQSIGLSNTLTISPSTGK